MVIPREAPLRLLLQPRSAAHEHIQDTQVQFREEAELGTGTPEIKQYGCEERSGPQLNRPPSLHQLK
jgi:hypothetical protein